METHDDRVLICDYTSQMQSCDKGTTATIPPLPPVQPSTNKASNDLWVCVCVFFFLMGFIRPLPLLLRYLQHHAAQPPIVGPTPAACRANR